MASNTSSHFVAFQKLVFGGELAADVLVDCVAQVPALVGALSAMIAEGGCLYAEPEPVHTQAMPTTT